MLIGDNTEGNSVLGDKADGLTQSAAHLVGSRALSLLGVPTALTMGVNAFGSEIENAYKNGATHTQAWISASVAAGAEILFERLSDGLKSPKGTNVDDATMQTLSQNISQKVVNTLLKWFKEDATEGLEEVFTDIVNKVAQKLTYADKMTWEKVFSTEDAWDSFLSGLLLSRGMSGADAIIVNSNVIQNEDLEDIAGKLSRGEALSAAEQQRLLDAVLKNTAPDTAADSNQSSRVAEPGKYGVGWDGRVAVAQAKGKNITIDGKTYALLGKDANGTPVYQDVEVLKEQAEAESKQTDDGKKVEVKGERKTIENPKKSGKMKIDTGGRRNETALNEKQFAKAKEAAMAQGYDGEIFYRDNSSTSFHAFQNVGDEGAFYYLVIGTDAYPKPNANGEAVERISLNGCMAHEVVGHYEAWKRGNTQSSVPLEEAQASIRAAKFGVGLTEEERAVLFEDGMDRLRAAGVAYEDVKKILDIWER